MKTKFAVIVTDDDNVLGRHSATAASPAIAAAIVGQKYSAGDQVFSVMEGHELRGQFRIDGEGFPHPV